MTTATKGKAMGKPRKMRDSRLDDMSDARVIAPIDHEPVETVTEQPDETVVISGECETMEVPLPKARRYSPPSCSACTALRPEGKDFTEVYSTKREGEYVFRYCRCKFCGNTFKDSERV